MMSNPVKALQGIFMDEVEKNIKSIKVQINVDIITCFVSTQRQLNSFDKFINNMHPNIKLTMELEQENKINFPHLNLE